MRELVSRQAIQKLIKQFVRSHGLDPAVSVHSLRVTALTTARERGGDIIDVPDFARRADPRTLSKSPAYVLNY